ncbi:hypothetical protein FZEAL_4897 [Fusarium zealandicum]|uniref:Uncharacterized protein n=1 Tax=Fusarium zealandicum TaxID=1053134 RepID=A0A8H4UKT6_9HYPO|nr:hypothetical protein FZEAL_4897 [Fusarium zealandicum]
MTVAGSSTPPPPTGIHTPPTPRFGFQDHWEPFTPRKSARISSQRASNRTPSPNSSNRQTRSPRTAKKTGKQPDTDIASPMSSPQKKRQPALDSVRRAPGNMPAESFQAAAALGLQRPSSSVMRTAGMLPTPSKTPQKPPNEKTTANIKSFARNLFATTEEDADADAMPSPKKRRSKKYTGISLESFTAEEVEDPIEIFTDTRDRVPARDESENNPFYGDIQEPESPKRRSKRKVKVPGEGVKTIDEASGREDGMVYVFRGKKFFRKFSEYDAEDLDELQGEEEDDEVYLSRPLTRAAIKPRLLFQSQKTEEEIDEEEAVTDVEDLDDEPVVPETPTKFRQERASTPEAPKFAPVSPPDTRRITRSVNKLMDEGTPIKNTGQRSPFDLWRRTKEPNKESSSRKRQGETLTPTHSKRSRT